MTAVGARILIVEDNPYSLELMSYLLHAHGHEVRSARTGVEAVRTTGAEQPDLILLDLQLPDLDGYEVLRALRALPASAHIKIIAVTAVAMVGDRERTLAAGFDHYMAKPINPRTFVRELDGWLPHAHHP
ncbi:response regulator [Phytohabitans aurantiacus]|uniref:Response regulator n=1 Tax=Phytohabitans aurantiacus TaxID=3016789 RepID=A0ABQ5R6X3_9ACTN|nr:response regulator [Phytohabitans aurantiacus]GLI02509.1 response regulator [Phytohabitans aurantiacus]